MEFGPSPSAVTVPTPDSRSGRPGKQTTWLEIEEYAFAHFLTPLKASSLLNFVMPTLLKNHPKSAEKSHTVSNSSIRFFPIRVHVFVMWLADLKAKPNANHANAHPMRAWSCRICNQHCTPPPFAELVSNPTPPGHIAREPVSLVFDPACRDLCVQEFCKATGLICGTDRAAYPHIRPRCHGKKNPVDSVTAKNVAAQKKATHATTASISIMPRRQSCDNRRQPSRRINKMPADITAAAIQNTTRNECRA